MRFRRKIMLNIEPTSNCTAACSMCPRSQIDSFGYLTLEIFEKVLSQAHPSQVWEICLAGRGEPTLHPRFPELTRRLSETGIPCSVVTTGANLNRKNLDACIRDLNHIRLSVSSAQRDLFAKIHVGLNYDRIWGNIEALAKEAGKKIIVHLTGGPEIYPGLPETVNRLRAIGVEQFRLLPLWNRGGDISSRTENQARRNWVKSLGISMTEKEHMQMPLWLFALNLIGHKARNLDYCPVGDSSVSMSYKGELLGCFQDFGHTSVLGSVNGVSLSEMVRLRRLRLGKMPICINCDAKKVALSH
jgi:MoaA/NifB/PqqE/SkfB family radical SAM enzyme